MTNQSRHMQHISPITCILYIFQLLPPYKNTFLKHRWHNSKSDPLITCANAEGNVKSFSVNSGKEMFELRADNSTSQFLCLDYDPNYASIAVGDNHGNIFIFDEVTQKLVSKFNKASWFANGHFNRVILTRSSQSSSSTMTPIASRLQAGTTMSFYGTEDPQRSHQHSLFSDMLPLDNFVV